MINTDIYLIGEEYVKENSVVMQNVEDGFFSSSIIEAQNIEFQEIICEEMYNTMIGQFRAYNQAIQTGTTSGITAYVEQRFLDLIDNYGAEVIKYYTLYHASFNFAVKIANKGLVEQNSKDFGESRNISRSMISDLRAQWKDIAENYTIKLVQYIVDNIDIYPEYQNCAGNCDTGGDRAGNSQGIYLGKWI